ncbi:MAG: 50S ribosomal protein L9 [Flavobacteriales bacterium]|jgi:large subunit ribosomal protein L9|nr:50S ribosomal protein L9 [Flavobacteriales bacterium]
MEIILIKDVANLGFADDIVNVKNGYGRNFLIPQGFAKLATPSAKKQLDETLKQRAFKEQKIVADAKEVAEKIKGLEVKLTAKVAKGSNKLFGSITNIDLEKFLSNNGISLEKKFISIVGGSIKALGKYTVKYRCHREVIVESAVEIVAEAE